MHQSKDSMTIFISSQLNVAARLVKTLDGFTLGGKRLEVSSYLAEESCGKSTRLSSPDSSLRQAIGRTGH